MRESSLWLRVWAKKSRAGDAVFELTIRQQAEVEWSVAALREKIDHPTPSNMRMLLRCWVAYLQNKKAPRVDVRGPPKT